MKTPKIINQLLRYCAIFGVSVAVTTISAADRGDHTVVIRSAQTVEQVVSDELQSARFAKQIASYNGIPSATTVLTVGSTLAIPRPYMESLDFGRIAYVKGDVRHSQTELVVNPPAKGSRVHNGDVIETGADGFVSLSFNSGARVNLQPESRVLIHDIDCVKAAVRCVISVQAISGKVSSEITPRPDGQPPVKFTVDTPFLSAAVRGTAFYVDLSGSEDRIGVTKGLVAAASGGSQNDLPKGKGLSAKPGVVPEVVDLLDPPTYSSDILLVSQEDVITWFALDGATTYQTNIAADIDMAETLLMSSTQQTGFTPQLDAGDYYLTVAGVDGKNFQGLPAKKKISYAEITDPEKPQISMIRRGDTVELSVPGHDGAAQLLIGNSFDADASYTIRELDNASETIQLELDESMEWVFRTRKVLGPYEVSAYSDYYVLQAK